MHPSLNDLHNPSLLALVPEAIQPAQAEFDNRLAMALDRIADRLKGDESAQKDDLTSAYAQLEHATWKTLPKEQHQLIPKIKSFLLLSRRIATLADCCKGKCEYLAPVGVALNGPPPTPEIEKRNHSEFTLVLKVH